MTTEEITIVRTTVTRRRTNPFGRGRAAAALSAVALAAGMVMTLPTTAQGVPAPLTWTSPGQHSWTVPEGVTQVRVDIAGGAGGNQPISDGPFQGGHWGGRGERFQGTLSVTPGEELVLYVGARGGDGTPGGGANSGGSGGQGWQRGGDGGSGSQGIVTPGYGQGGGGGGGSSYIGRTGYVMYLHVGGGGGAGGFAVCGGNPGGDAGKDARKEPKSCASNGGDPGRAGDTDGPGADGANAASSSGQGGGGGGGGGIEGGGGGDASTDGGGGGGGGSSSYSTQFTVESRSFGNHGSNGYIRISPLYPTEVELDQAAYEIVAGNDVPVTGSVGYPGSLNPGVAPAGTVRLESGDGSTWTTMATVDVESDGSFAFVCDAGCVVDDTATTLRAVYVPSSTDHWTPSSATAPLQILLGATSTTLDVDPESAVTGQAREYVATVQVHAPAVGPADGDVEFWGESVTTGEVVLLGTAPLQPNGRATLEAVPPFTGEHRVRALYLGSGWFDGSFSPWRTFVTQRAATRVEATVVPEPSVFGQDFEVEVSVEALPPAVGVPEGVVEVVIDDGVPFFAELDHGTATVEVAGGTDAGERELHVRYLGDDSFLGAEAIVPHVIEPGDVELSLAQDVAATAFGEPVTLTVDARHVDPAAGEVTGDVTIWVDGEPTDAVGTFDGSRAVIELSGLDVGEHTIEARFAGSPNWRPAVSDPLGHEVVAAEVTVAITPDRDTITVGTTALLRIDVAPATPAQDAVTGDVDLFAAPDGTPAGQPLASVSLREGTGYASLDGLDVGQHPLVAVFRGSARFVTASSAALDVTVVPAASGTTLTLPHRAVAGAELILTGRVETRESVLSAQLPSSGVAAALAAMPRPGQWAPFPAPGEVQLLLDGEPAGDSVPIEAFGTEEPGVAGAVWRLELDAGAYVVQAEYLGADTVLGSRSTITTLVVAPSASDPRDPRDPRRELPRTGGQAVELLLVSALLVGVGGLAVRASRRRVS